RIVRQTPQCGPLQAIAIEGPYRRLLFRLEERTPLGEFNLDLSHGRVTLVGGRLVGIHVGDRLELWAPNEAGRSVPVGEAEVSGVSSSHAELDLRVRLEQLRLGASA